ncbi:MAG TPA: sulfatase-like hydrolase/transferase [Casimicrobiaceae bacterium]|nr:sulfatase-like hydrolase/transferase [Casimicrobiaceae bacterium]
MDDTNDRTSTVTRREFLAQVSAGVAATTLLGSELLAPREARAASAGAGAGTARGKSGAPYNIVFVFTDQERYFDRWPKGLSLPGHERLQRTGVTFHNHYCPAVMCTSTRSVIMTGLQTADNGMFENADVPWIKPLSPNIPTVGHMLRKAGYYTAYKGKWHLDKAFDSTNADRLFTTEMEAYGFADYLWPGDVVGHTLGGYKFDHLIAGSAVSWLRNKGQPLSDEGKPWALFVSLVNPHDIMYFNADAADERIQDTGRLLSHAARAPDHRDYKATWNVPLPHHLTQSFDEPGRPKAHGEFDKAWGHTLGRIPPDAAHWQRFNDYYINSIRAVDAQLLRILNELDALGLSKRTIFVFTSDHGEAAGAHGLRGKGPFAYQENLHLPFYAVHPDVRGGQDSHALTSHIDIAPTLLTMAGMDGTRMAEAAGRNLPGKDIGTVLGNPRASQLHSIRDSVLFTYSGIGMNDSELTRVLAEAKNAGKDLRAALKESGFRPDLRKRGSMRTVFDGRYKYSRYFSPLQRNRPTTLDEVYQWNDPELFDLQSDPAEIKNAAMTKGVNEALVMTMNAKLNAAIDAEFGKDDGREMPEMAGVSWAVDAQNIDL